jgi:multidrug efflux pump
MITGIYKQKSAIILMLLFIVFSGISTYFSIPKEEFPEIKIPLIYVSVVAIGISPEDAESTILKPLERRLKSITGVKKVTSQATNGYGSVSIEFTPTINIANALNDVRNKVSEARVDMPKDILEPVIKEIDFSKFPVLTVAVVGDVPFKDLVSSAKFLKKKIEEIPEVLEVKIVGSRQEIVKCEIDPSKWHAYKMNYTEIQRALASNNQLIAAGKFANNLSEFSIKIPGLVKTTEQIGKIPVKNVNGAIITIADVAKVYSDFENVKQIGRTNFKPSVVLEISKRSGKNLLQTVAKMRSVISNNEQYLSSGAQVVFSRDSSQNVVTRLNDLINNIIAASILVVYVVVVQIGRRQGFIVGFSIPISFFIGLLVVKFLGFTMNNVVLFAFIMSVGMIVDASIIVTEYADKRMRDGLLPSMAYIDAARRMSVPVLSATIGLIVVYMPLLFWPGTVGQFMKFIPITLMAVLAASIVAAMIFVPVLGGAWCDAVYKKDKNELLKPPSFANKMDKITALYAAKLEKTIQHPKRMIVFSVALLFISIFSYGFLGHGVEFFTKIEPDSAEVLIKQNGNASIYEKARIAQIAEEKIKKFSNEVDIFYTTIGEQPRDKGLSPDVIVKINLQLKQWDKRRKAEVILNDIRLSLKDIPGIKIEATEERKGPAQGKMIEAQILGQDRAQMQKISDGLYSFMSTDPDLINVSDSRESGRIEWNIAFDRNVATRYGVDLGSFGNTIRMATTGAKVGQYIPNDSDENIDITLFLPKDRQNFTNIRNILVPTPLGLIAASEFIKFSPKPETITIERLNSFNVVKISADAKKRQDAFTKIGEITKWFEQNNTNKTVSLAFGGDKENQDETSAFLKTAFGIAIFIKIAILIVQFNSIYYTMVVMSSVVLSVAGVFFGLMIMGKTFSIVMCGLGIVSLAGIVVSNNIIFIDTYQRLLETGMEVKKAIIETATQRLRPILMTSATTIIGLIPMAFNVNIDFLNFGIEIGSPSGQWWEQLSTTIASGLICTTVLTLFLTPSILMIYSPVTKKHND